MSDLGLIQVYTGNGKGKTTASLGLALRASGHGFKVCMIQFMKNNNDYGEVKASKLLPGFKIVQVGRNDFVNMADPEPIDIKLAQDGWNLAKSVIIAKEYDIVILDEINVALACNLLDVNEVASFLCGKQQGIPEIIMTGRYAPQKIIDIAHLVTDMQEVTHCFNKGVPARKGIDF